MAYKVQFPAYRATRPTLEEQLKKVRGEAQEAAGAEGWRETAMELFDTIHACETALAIIARQREAEYRAQGMKGDAPKMLALIDVYEDTHAATIEKNRQRGYYGKHDTK